MSSPSHGVSAHELSIEVLDAIQRSFDACVSKYALGYRTALADVAELKRKLAAVEEREAARDARIAALETANAELQRTITELEELRHEIKQLRESSLKYCGIWEAGVEYAPGNSLTYDGSMWIALRPTSAQPGQSKEDWQLAVRKGRAGRFDKGLLQRIEKLEGMLRRTEKTESNGTHHAHER